VLGAVFHFKGSDLAVHLGHQIHLAVFFATPVRKAHVLRATTRKQVFEHGGFGGYAERGRVFQNGLSLTIGGLTPIKVRLRELTACVHHADDFDAVRFDAVEDDVVGMGDDLP